jgi:hypothetical protein
MQAPDSMITHMRFRRGLLAAALAASLSIVWAQEAQASQTIVISVSQWAYANSSNVNLNNSDSFVGPGDPSPAAPILRVGNDTTGIIYRGFMRFQLNNVSGRILDAQLVGRLDHSWSCSSRINSFYRTAPIAAAPRQSWPGPALELPLGTTLLHANESTCAQPNMPFELSSSKLRIDLQAALNVQQFGYFVGVSARDLGGAGESAVDRWMRYFLNDFKLVITYEPV